MNKDDNGLEGKNNMQDNNLDDYYPISTEQITEIIKQNSKIITQNNLLIQTISAKDKVIAELLAENHHLASQLADDDEDQPHDCYYLDDPS